MEKHPLQAARNRHGLTQRDLSKATGVDQSVIARIELGSHYVKIDHLREFARVLKVPMRELLLEHQAVASFTSGDVAEFFGIDPVVVRWLDANRDNQDVMQWFDNLRQQETAA